MNFKMPLSEVREVLETVQLGLLEAADASSSEISNKTNVDLVRLLLSGLEAAKPQAGSQEETTIISFSVPNELDAAEFMLLIANAKLKHVLAKKAEAEHDLQVLKEMSKEARIQGGMLEGPPPVEAVESSPQLPSPSGDAARERAVHRRESRPPANKKDR